MTCHGGLNQKWQKIKNSDGTYTFKSLATGHEDKCLDSPRIPYKYGGTLLHAHTCNGGNNQKWRIDTIKSKNLNITDFVNDLYRVVGNREPDGDEFNYWVNQIKNGVSYDEARERSLNDSIREYVDNNELQSYFGKFSMYHKLLYSVYGENWGWYQVFENGDFAGTEGKNLPLDAFQAKVEGCSLSYKGYYNNSWTNWFSDGEVLGLPSKMPLEKIFLNLQECSGYSILYRVHVSNKGWQDWATNNQETGVSGESIEAIKIVLVKN